MPPENAVMLLLLSRANDTVPAAYKHPMGCRVPAGRWKDVHPGLKVIALDTEYASPFGIIYPKEHGPATEHLVESLAFAS